ncbi:GIG1 family protein [Aspergillus ibericus CBS 121593]|uniref:N-acetylglucosamine-induced protein 1 n=1 Tax=Aspergillus ibericus CBS 121593 TaxID=1448316 RepID=A0A395GP22_9EURO|nr:hypothetical protein BO80DRAFT_428423 [Aspergillus ibericus CBS 121593]RAK97260.1 hypothetical protein BO80DRAFT_428423 [Aspergillus ibericus CBS 121593]
MTPEEPPAFNLTEVDRQVLALTDDEFILHDWEDLKAIIARNDLGILKRKPSDLTRYLAWSHETKLKYGTITNYICQHRLGWEIPPSSSSSSSTSTSTRTNTPSTQSTSSTSTSTDPIFPYTNPIPFAHPDDYKILRNDWPYGLTPDISHLVVWLRTPVAVKPENGDVTEESRALIEGFVQRVFVERLVREITDVNGEGEGVAKAKAKDQVLWFKNWTALQSVRSLEHIHVLVRDVPERILVEWTGEGETRH